MFKANRLLAIIVSFFFVVSMGSCGGGGGGGEVSTPELSISAFSDALKSGDASKAIEFVEESSQSRFETIFSDLGIDGIRELGETLNNAESVYVGEGYAEYRTIVTFPNGDRVVGTFSLVKTSAGWKFNQI